MLEPLSLSELQHPLGGRLIGPDLSFTSVSTDTRSIQPGQLFVALVGPRFDGHDYLQTAAEQGAVAALVSRPVPGGGLSLLQVDDTRQALGQLGALNRCQFKGRMAAITGSSGKTTVKEMLASILRAGTGDPEAVLATRGNLNNDLGVPLTLLELSAGHQAAVLELGASRLGEIAYTVALVRPQVALITNAGTAHVGEFGGPERIVQAKGEILDGLEADGIAVLNRDDPAFPVWSHRAGARRVTSFSAGDAEADVYARSIRIDRRGCCGFELLGDFGTLNVQLNLAGRHNVGNAAAAAAAARALGESAEAIRAGLEALQPVKGRGVRHAGRNGALIIDDTYNANPASVRAAIDLLAASSGRQVLVLGDMGELGDWAESLHREVGSYARGKVQALYAVGPLMAHAVEAFGSGGQHFADQQTLIESLQAVCNPDTTLLVKGSRSAAMDRVVAALCSSSKENA